MWKLLAIILLNLLLLCAAAVGYGYWIYQEQLLKPLPLENELVYELPPRTGLTQVADDFQQRGLLTWPAAKLWVVLARWNQQATRIKSGEYAISAGTTPQGLLNILISGQAIQYGLTIPEGLNFRELMALVRKHPKLEQTLTGLDDAGIMEKLGYGGEHPEGRFYPDTYHFPTRTTDVSFLQRAYRKMEQELEDAWQQRVDGLPLKTPYEALILASLVEKETGDPAERPQIAGVFVRRLQQNMLLQTDPTVIYALGEAYDGNIRQADLQVDNPYNTYRYGGLPPTPIALPGRAALLAAVQPKEGDTLFFVASGNGQHYFSANLAEHECAVIQYQIKGKNNARFRSRCQQYPQCAACQ